MKKQTVIITTRGGYRILENLKLGAKEKPKNALN